MYFFGVTVLFPPFRKTTKPEKLNKHSVPAHEEQDFDLKMTLNVLKND